MRAALACVFLAAGPAAGAAALRRVTVRAAEGRLLSYHFGESQSAGDAVGTFEDTLNSTGWGILNVASSEGTPDSDQAFAAGAAEGLLTAPRIWEHYINMYQAHFGDMAAEDVAKVRSFMAEHDKWSREQIKANPDSPFWRQVGNVFAQFDGLVAGYNAAAADGVYPVSQLDLWAFQVLNSDGDLFQVVPAVIPKLRKDFDRMSPEEAELALQSSGHCSALIRVTGNFSDLFMGHSSWYHYAATNRIYKHYNFRYAAAEVAARRVSFSSYPGYLSSLDDFYMMDSGLGMVQTSIGFANKTLYDLIKPQSLMAWQRVRTAHVLAHSGPEWYNAVKTGYSGTYSNTYMVVDWNKFTPGQPLQPGTLWVQEEIPGQFPGADVTDVLAFGYWPSYNVPYFPQVYGASGLRELAARGIPSADFQTAPRAEIFRRDAGTVRDIDSYKAILRYNEYVTDPYAGPTKPCNAICCRGDLRPGSAASAGGCYDTKVTHYAWVKEMQAEIINGPTRGGTDKIAPFSWGAFPNTTHVGLPQSYTFDFIKTKPRAP
eukprot:TRINITY_DN18365_c0_g1_i1.p2 TRINITY_DN18365_c0_g1~~TRINITY_DN18365_c0_g1_i1.p2  ORF type:complete len:569 (+),score=213.54 TRINITY_DN18365_c0_g1_i1:81-1709(+)